MTCSNAGSCNQSCKFFFLGDKIYSIILYFFLSFYRSGVGAPTIGEMDGDYNYDARRSMLEWKMPVIDSTNPSGSLEFTISGVPDDFFPVNVSFYSTKTICDFQVCELLYVYNSFICRFDFSITNLTPKDHLTSSVQLQNFKMCYRYRVIVLF